MNEDNPKDPPIQKAAALKYDKEKDAAPRLAAKGRAHIAQKIIELAKANNVPIRKDEDLVTILEKLEVDQEIPIEIYSVVAEIFSYIYKTSQKAKNAL